jgi:hypothetical protein
MPQFDLLLTQNVHATGVEFSEKYVNIAKGGLLSAIAAGVPTVLVGGPAGCMLVRDDAEVTGLKWQIQPSLALLHTQNTDSGTTSATFELDNDGYKIELTAESASKFGVKVDGGATYADIQAKDATFAKVTVAAAPVAGTDLTNKTYVDGLLASNDAMVFKGTVGTGGTFTIAAFNALLVYDAGWSYKVIEAGTIKGVVCEIGDMLVSTVDRASAGVNADWVVLQTNIDGAVTGPASVALGDNIAVFNGTSGKIIKDGGTTIAAINTLISNAQTAANNAIPKATLTAANQVLIATAASTPSVLQVVASSFVGMKATGNIAALSGTEAKVILGIDGIIPAAITDIDAGTDNVKYASSLALAGSNIVRGAGVVVADTLAAFNGTSGKLLKASSLAISAITNWVTAPASKTSPGTAGQVAQDGNFWYICTALNTWKRSPIATNW